MECRLWGACAAALDTDAGHYAGGLEYFPESIADFPSCATVEGGKRLHNKAATVAHRYRIEGRRQLRMYRDCHRTTVGVLARLGRNHLYDATNQVYVAP